MLNEAFQELLTLTGELRPGFKDSLGVPAGEEALIGRLPEAPELLKAVYGAVSGTREETEEAELIEFIPGYRLIHIEELNAESEALAKVLEEKGLRTEGILLPLLTNYGGNYLCYSRSEDGTERVVDLMRDYGELSVMFDSPESFLRTLCEFYRQEVYFVDEEGFIDCDLIREGEVGAALNPESDYWAAPPEDDGEEFGGLPGDEDVH